MVWCKRAQLLQLMHFVHLNENASFHQLNDSIYSLWMVYSDAYIFFFRSIQPDHFFYEYFMELNMQWWLKEKVMKTGTKNQIKFTLYNVIKKMEIIYSFTRARICMVLFFFLTGFHFLPIDIHVLTSSYELAHCILHACLTQLIVTMLLCLLHK